MKKIIFITLALLFNSLASDAQFLNNELEEESLKYNLTLGQMSKSDSTYLCGLPELPIPDLYRSPNPPLLPFAFDNSTQPYFRPPYNQAGYSCGQAALVGYNYTYEINRVRDLSGYQVVNQYPTHFTWNFWNAGNQYGGVSYFTSMEIMKAVGNPNVLEYGGMANGGEKRWMSGYDLYYSAMHNRITTAYSLKVNTPEGIENLKHYIHDHLENSDVGGLASFYANQPPLYTLPTGTPEEGKKVVVGWSYSTHALTIVGWNDSIRWDYNNDGEYTNHIDINNDGVVNVKDWEIGGFKLVNSYGGVPNWGDGGFAYMMYKTVADQYGQGGIWNNTVNTLKVKEDCNPQLTMKVTLKHSRRKAVKIMAGYSTDTTATEPEYLIDFPIFNYQGGNNFMQGGTTEEDKIIEFGLDISYFLSYLEVGEYAKIFLRVNEHDPEQWGSGKLVSFSLMDYTNGVNEIICNESNITIPHNGTVTVSVVHELNHEEISIDNVSLPPAPSGMPYNYQLNASGGSDPYFWSLNYDFTETDDTGIFPSVSANHLYLPNNDKGTVDQPIDFSFPFYGNNYETITIHADGFLKFDDDIYIWPYFQSDELLFKKTALIAPFMADLRIYPAQGDGIWYEGDESGAIFYWKASLIGQSTETDLNFCVKLFPDGDIKFYYGTMETNGAIQWYGGTSKGNSLDYQFLGISGDVSIANNYNIDFACPFYPSEMTISDDGIFSGTPQGNYTGMNIKFKATDNNNIFTTKTLQFSVGNIIIDPSIISGDDDIIEYAENTNLSIDLTNSSGIDMTDVSMNIYINDTNFYLIDSTQFIGNLGNDSTVNLIDAFNFDVSPQTPNYHNLIIETEIISDDTTYTSNLFFTAYSPFIHSDSEFVNDGANNILDPGETTNIIVDIENSGGSDAEIITFNLSSNDSYVTINSSVGSISFLPVDSVSPLNFNISVNENTPIGHTIEFILDISTSNGYVNSDTFSLSVGFTDEDFESGNFSHFPWGFTGDKDWIISNDHVYQGIFSAQSGNISYNQESSLIMDVNVEIESEISFYRKVSCQEFLLNDNEDYLSFLIDGVEQERWDGQIDWGREAYSVSLGHHRFEWRFKNDHEISSYFNRAWIDSISFPSATYIAHDLDFSYDEIHQEMEPETVKTDTLIISNLSDFGEVNYQIHIDNSLQQTANRSIAGSYLECSDKYLIAGQNFQWTFSMRNQSEDSEWIKDIYISFPTGIIIDSVTDFVGGSGGDLEDNLTPGNGVTVNWHGEDDQGYGLIKGFESAEATVYGHTETTFTEDFSITSEIHGDIYGGDPHILFFNNEFKNLGETNNWLTLDTLEGTVDSGISDKLLLNFNSISIPEGEYFCELIITDNFKNETIIPVSLLVDINVGKGESTESLNYFKVYPNPFVGTVSLTFDLKQRSEVKLKVIDARGNMIKEKRLSILSEGKHKTKLDLSDVSPGIFLVELEINGNSVRKKIIKSN